MTESNSQSSVCPLCKLSAKIVDPIAHNRYDVNCGRCGTFQIDRDLPSQFGCIIPDTDRHLLGGYTREQWQFAQTRAWLGADNYRRILAQCPQTVREKADKLLLAIQRQTKYFGQDVPITPTIDYPLAYAQNPGEFDALLEYLTELGFIKRKPNAGIVGAKPAVVVTAPGWEAIESRVLSPTITVFISSTCHDLLDLRAELADFLESKGVVVKVSDDADRFEVEPTEDSVQTCLRNVEASDVVIVILDGRYGRPLPPEKELSATHVEVRHARSLERPIYIFGRDKALAEYDLLRRLPDAPTLRVEKHDDDNRKKWVAFVQELSAFAVAHASGHSNWVDPFQNSVQLKKLVLKRLGDYQRKRLTKDNTNPVR